LAAVDEVVATASCPGDAFYWISSVKPGSDPALLQDVDYPWKKGAGFGTVDAKLAAALARLLTGEFARKLRVMKTDAMQKGSRLIGRRLLLAVDEEFQVADADGAMYGIEHLFSITMRNDNLAKFMSEWEQVLSGLKTRPADAVLEAVLLRQLRRCAAMGDDVREYERRPDGDVLRSYEGLMRAAKKAARQDAHH
jgi:hypothetical protein